MATLVPRWFGDLTEWLEERPLAAAGHVIKVEDSATDQEYRIRAELPGMDPEKDIQVSVDDGTLEIHAERRLEEHKAGRTEFQYGALQRIMRLPGNADSEHVKASYDKGILEVVVPLKGEPAKGRKIPVTAG